MTDEHRKKAQEAIEGRWDIAYDVAAMNGQQFENVRHMNWFVEAVASAIAADEDD